MINVVDEIKKFIPADGKFHYVVYCWDLWGNFISMDGHAISNIDIDRESLDTFFAVKPDESPTERFIRVPLEDIE